MSNYSNYPVQFIGLPGTEPSTVRTAFFPWYLLVLNNKKPGYPGKKLNGFKDNLHMTYI